MKHLYYVPSRFVLSRIAGNNKLVKLVIVVVMLGSLTILRSSFSIQQLMKDRAVQSHNQSSQSPRRFSTGSAAFCRRMSTSSDDKDRKLCRSILDGDVNQTLSSTVTWQPSTLDDYVECASDCDRFRSEFGYWTSVDDLSKEEVEFPLAFR